MGSMEGLCVVWGRNEWHGIGNGSCGEGTGGMGEIDMVLGEMRVEGEQ